MVVFDDIQWGEPTFLDLLEYLADWVRGAPVLLLCLARPELLDVRPEWVTPKANAELVTLTPLTAHETDGLIQGLLEGDELEPEARVRITEMAEGNPLFVEQTLRMLVDDGALERRDGRWTATQDLSRITIPPTISALLTARLDRLDAASARSSSAPRSSGACSGGPRWPRSRAARCARTSSRTCSRSPARS